jgi:hypothetical protein
MSYWVYLENENGDPVEVGRHQEGGTHCVGGISLAELNVTYNYGRVYNGLLGERTLKEALDGKVARDVIDVLEHAVRVLGIERDEDYWKATRGNAGHALSIILGWAIANPEAVFRVS